LDDAEFWKQCGFNPGIVEQAVDILDTGLLIAGRIGGIEANRILE